MLSYGPLWRAHSLTVLPLFISSALAKRRLIPPIQFADGRGRSPLETPRCGVSMRTWLVSRATCEAEPPPRRAAFRRAQRALRLSKGVGPVPRQGLAGPSTTWG